MRLHTALSGAAALALVLASCGGSDDDAPEAAEAPTEPAAEGPGEPVTLQMASSYGSLEYVPAVAHFVEQVEQLSNGDLSIEVIYAFGEFQPDAEQQVVQAVTAGEVDLAWTGTRIFDTLGVTSFTALHAPLLVDSYPLQAALIESDIPDHMLAELDHIGVTGLAVLAGGLRKPFAVDGPLLEPDDYSGLTLQLFQSEVQADTLAALGASPTSLGPDQRDAGLAAGEVHGIEQSLLTYSINAMESLVPYVTVNVNLWPETTALIVNQSALAELGETHADWLREAATNAALSSAELHDVDAGLLDALCSNGARMAEASDADLASLRDAVESVYTELITDALTAELITEIESLKETIPAEPLAIPDGCVGDAPTAQAAGLTPRYAGDTDSPLGYYEYLPPGYGDRDPRPLLVALNGFGGNGDGSPDELDNLFEAGIPDLIRTGNWSAELPFVILAPQHPWPLEETCPDDEPYVGSCVMHVQHERGHPDAASPCTTPDEVHAFLGYAEAAYDVDPDRVYLTGISCGGYAAWAYIAEHGSSQVAAIVPIAADGRPAWDAAGCALGEVAVWAFHGDADDIVHPEGSTETIANLADCPSARGAELTIYPGVDHDSWTRTYDLSAGHDIYEWLLGFSRR